MDSGAATRSSKQVNQKEKSMKKISQKIQELENEWNIEIKKKLAIARKALSVVEDERIEGIQTDIELLDRELESHGKQLEQIGIQQQQIKNLTLRVNDLQKKFDMIR